MGSAIEYYEFTAYGFLAVVFAPLFFPTDNPAAATLSALAIFGGGYLARPLGGVVFGALGDRLGRKPVLLVTIFLMGFASMAIGLIPTYAQIGLIAPLLLLLLRVLQGLSAGGEFTGAQTYIVEMAPPKKRGVYGSLPALGICIGFASGALMVGAVTLFTTPEQMTSWGWRIPFLVCIPLTVVCLLIRRHLEEAPGFQEISEREETAKNPVRDVLRSHFPAVLKVIGLAIAILGPAFLGKLYMAIFLVQERGLDKATVYFTLGGLLALSACAYPVMGSLSDRIGRRPLVLAGCAAYLVMSLPLFLVTTSTSSLWAVAPVLLCFVLIEAAMSGAVYTTIAELFPEKVRYTGTSVGFNIGAIIAAGFGPYISAQLVAATGSQISPAFWGIGCALLGIIVYFTLAETSESTKDPVLAPEETSVTRVDASA
ncbi:MFS transporter [Rhodococcus ruber]|uniref:MFS transporter n=1 Tax=Rhodococcus ruber TaxID=1830 RepID=UPI00315DBF8D